MKLRQKKSKKSHFVGMFIFFLSMKCQFLHLSEVKKYIHGESADIDCQLTHWIGGNQKC